MRCCGVFDGERCNTAAAVATLIGCSERHFSRSCSTTSFFKTDEVVAPCHSATNVASCFVFAVVNRNGVAIAVQPSLELCIVSCAVAFNHFVLSLLRDGRYSRVNDGECCSCAVGQAASIGQHPGHSDLASFTTAIAQHWVGRDAAPARVATGVAQFGGASSAVQPILELLLICHDIRHVRYVSDRIRGVDIVIAALNGEVLRLVVDDRSRCVLHSERGHGGTEVSAEVSGHEGHFHRTSLAAIVAQGRIGGNGAPGHSAGTVVGCCCTSNIAQPLRKGRIVGRISCALDGFILSSFVNDRSDFVTHSNDLLCFS